MKLLSLTIIAITIIVAGCSNSKNFVPPFYETETAAQDVENVETFGHVKKTIKETPLHFVHTGVKTSPVILFIHGSPGSWDAWADYLNDKDLYDRSFMMAVDRPGFGQSNDGNADYSLKEQADSIIGAVQEIISPEQKIIVVGHSYGGPVALKIATDYPQSIQSLVLLAPAISPDLMNVRWYNRLANLWGIHSILPTALHHSNEEMLSLPSELAKMQPDLSVIKFPITLIQGGKDGLVDPRHVEFTKETFINTDVDIHFLEDQGHFIPWNEYDLVKETLMKHLSTAK